MRRQSESEPTIRSRRAEAADPATSPERLSELADTPSLRLRATVASNPNWQPAVLSALSNGIHPRVRVAADRDPELSPGDPRTSRQRRERRGGCQPEHARGGGSMIPAGNASGRLRR